MDNITHTLVGVALADTGLKRTTRYGTAVLVIGANLPDVDGLTYFVASGTDALAFRRGWTHGILAMALLPLVLTGAALAWGRLVARPRDGSGPALRPGWLLALATVGIWTHPLLDLLNTYGVRLLMPFSQRWFYGDTLFIVDPWVWTVLLLGILATRVGRRRELPVRLALATAAGYVLVMAASSALGRASVERQAGSVAVRTLVAPVPVTPFRREVLRDLGDRYEFGELALPRMVYSSIALEPAGLGAPGVAAASATRAGRQFLHWSRFPQFTTQRRGDSIRVVMSDARYARPGEASWASVQVTVPAEPR